MEFRGTFAGRAARRLTAAGLAAVLSLTGCTHSTSAPKANARSSRSTSPSPGVVGRGTSAATVAPTADPPRASLSGRVVRVVIKATDGFRPRPAYLFVPRVLRTHPSSHVPVLELLHGTPGGPADWLTRGGLLATADAFAAAHHGLVPLVVLPDINGTQRGDSECIRTATGADVESYLTQDVVTYVRHRFARAVGRRRWWIAGLSEGGLCAAVLALRHPSTYSAFGDLSGLARPIVEHLTQAASDQLLFRGDRTALLQHDPVWLLRNRRYRGSSSLHGWFACGDADLQVRDAQTALVAAARAAHLPVAAQLRAGRHTWTIWDPALRDLLAWLWTHAAA